MIWGVDSGFDRQRPNFTRNFRDQQKTVFEIIEDLSGMTPQFWGRYILGVGRQHTFEDAERIYLHSRNCKIIPIVTGLEDSLRRGQFRDGQIAANRAIRRARQLHIPHSVRIYADLEQWSFIQSEWILGWWVTMSNSPSTKGAGRLYGRPNITMYSSLEQSRHATGIEFRQPRAHSARLAYDHDWLGRQVVGTRWGNAASVASRTPGSLGISFVDRELSILMSGDISQLNAISRVHWSNEPRTIRENPSGRGAGNVMPSSFSPTRLVNGGVITAIWQYRFSCYSLRRGGVGLVDLNVATEAAFDEMW